MTGITQYRMGIPTQLHTGSVQYPTRAITATTTLDETDSIILVDSSAGAVTVNLPTAVGRAGRLYVIKIDTGGNLTTIDPLGAETIDEAATRVLNMEGSYLAVVSDGANWEIVDMWIEDKKRVGHTAAVAHTSSGSWQALDPGWNTIRYGAANLSSGTAALVVRVAGKYRFTANIEWAGNATGNRGVRLMRNGGANLIAQVFQTNAGAGGAVAQNVSGVWDMVAADNVRVEIFQDSGGNLNVNSSGTYSPEFSMEYVGR